MEAINYTIIKSKKQYNQYCKRLERLIETNAKQFKNEIELLTLLIEKWDVEHNTFQDLDPIELLHSLLQENKMKAQELVDILGISKSHVSEILNYKKGLSKEVIRKLSDHFKVSQEAFNRPYKLRVPENTHFRNASVMNTTKVLVLE